MEASLMPPKFPDTLFLFTENRLSCGTVRKYGRLKTTKSVVLGWYLKGCGNFGVPVPEAKNYPGR